VGYDDAELGTCHDLPDYLALSLLHAAGSPHLSGARISRTDNWVEAVRELPSLIRHVTRRAAPYLSMLYLTARCGDAFPHPPTMLITFATTILLGSAAAGPVLQPPRAVRLHHRSASPALQKRGLGLECVTRNPSLTAEPRTSSSTGRTKWRWRLGECVD
jgi:hypothetical protein